MSNRVEAPVYF